MRYKQNLRRRITFSFALFGALLSFVIASGVYYALEDVEEELVKRGLDRELEHFLRHGDKKLGTTRQINADIVLYYVNEAQKKILPDIIRTMPLGHSDFEYEAQLYYTLVANTDEGTVYLIRDATAFEHLENTIQMSLAASVIAATLIALWLGNWLSARVISPVSALAQQVSAMTPGHRTQTPLAWQYAHDEVGQLAATFDTYLQQMEDFIQREQEFTADASHELRTPLAVINGAAELLLENPDLSERALGQVERIARAGERMQSMLEILLLLAREVPAGQHTHPEVCVVQDVVQEVLEQQRFLCLDKPLTLRSEVISGFELNASKTVLTIVLSNLIRNAVNFTERGEVTVKVTHHAIEVSDTGIGIEQAALQHIFERHYRNPQSKGNGIGLSIVKRICDRHGWQIDVTSKPGSGTRVTLRFASPTHQKNHSRST